MTLQPDTTWTWNYYWILYGNTAFWGTCCTAFPTSCFIVFPPSLPIAVRSRVRSRSPFRRTSPREQSSHGLANSLWRQRVRTRPRTGPRLTRSTSGQQGESCFEPSATLPKDSSQVLVFTSKLSPRFANRSEPMRLA